MPHLFEIRIVAGRALEHHVAFTTVNFSLRFSCVSFARLQGGGSETEKKGEEGKSKARLPLGVQRATKDDVRGAVARHNLEINVRKTPMCAIPLHTST